MLQLITSHLGRENYDLNPFLAHKENEYPICTHRVLMPEICSSPEGADN